jgi:hypothetical protein
MENSAVLFHSSSLSDQDEEVLDSSARAAYSQPELDHLHIKESTYGRPFKLTRRQPQDQPTETMMTLALCLHRCCAGRAQSKRVFAGIIFGIGTDVDAVNFMAWLFPGG